MWLSSKESHRELTNATKLHRKSGVAKWRDLLFLFRFSHTLFSPWGGWPIQALFWLEWAMHLTKICPRNKIEGCPTLKWSRKKVSPTKGSALHAAEKLFRLKGTGFKSPCMTIARQQHRKVRLEPRGQTDTDEDFRG